ncbi:MAG TPA: PIN domain-containing protein [Terriglobia bacterium]|nr:PIN domain-containing protein [Terriglobia bacterium]
MADLDDSPFLECALDGRADYLITGNKRHFPSWTIIITPRDFLKLQSH